MIAQAHTAESLAALIRAEFIGVDPDSQGVVLEDHDWQMIVAALTAFEAEPTAYRWHWANFPDTFHYAGSFTGTAHPMQVVRPLYAKASREADQ